MKLKEYIKSTIDASSAKVIQIEVHVNANLDVDDNAPNIVRLSIERKPKITGFSEEEMERQIRATINKTKEGKRQ